MEYIEFQRQLGKAGLTNKQFASLVKANPSSIANYSKVGKVPSHWAIIATLMGVLADNKVDFSLALSRIDISPKKVRGGAAKGRFGGSKQGDLLGEL